MCCHKKRVAYAAACGPQETGPYYNGRRGCGPRRHRGGLIRSLITKAIERREQKRALLQEGQNQEWPVEKAEDSGHVNAQQVPDADQYHGVEEYVLVDEAQDTKARPEMLPRYSQVMRS